ncbi:MAG TPA: hypothetical protein VMV79_08425 [Alphaproteobacteria bacterium]|nr:hypothetical protein [Alphaproteobacteria bacterium]
MATIDLRELSGDDFVLHFGGRPNEVDAYTFANSILAFSEALREINHQLNPEFRIEIAIDALGSGSFRARLKTGAKKVSGLFATSLKELLIGILAAMIYAKISDAPVKIVVNDDSYVIEQGHDRIILPKEIYEAKNRLSDFHAIDRHLTQAFDTLKEDPSITEFGITRKIDDKKPIVVIPRKAFDRLSETQIKQPDQKQKFIEKNAKLVVIKAVFERSERKWQFVWNGIRISAPIKDQTFFDRLAKREFEFGQGDILDVVLGIHQTLDDVSGAYINDSYEILKVLGHTQGPKQMEMLP